VLQHGARREAATLARALSELASTSFRAGFPAAFGGDWEKASMRWRAKCRLLFICRSRTLQTARTLSLPRRRCAMRHATACTLFLARARSTGKYKLNTGRRIEILASGRGGRAHRAPNLCADVEFSPRCLAARSLSFSAQVVEALIDAGATTVNIPDTSGYTVPD